MKRDMVVFDEIEEFITRMRIIKKSQPDLYQLEYYLFSFMRLANWSIVNCVNILVWVCIDANDTFTLRAVETFNKLKNMPKRLFSR